MLNEMKSRKSSDQSNFTGEKSDYFSVRFDDDGFLEFLDQTKLPLEEIYIKTDNYERIAEAIERLEVRGAPLIGVCAAYAVALAFKSSS